MTIFTIFIRRNFSMETYGLEQYGITGIKEIVYNPTYSSFSRPRWILPWRALRRVR